MAFAVSADGTRIFYEVAGSGPPLLLQTASFSTARHWEGQIESFSKHWRVVTWDYRGHGRSEAPVEPERYTLQHVLQDLEAVHQAAAGLEPGFVGGLSIGGLVSLCYALAHADRVRALVLINTGPGFRNPEALAEARKQLTPGRVLPRVPQVDSLRREGITPIATTRIRRSLRKSSQGVETGPGGR